MAIEIDFIIAVGIFLIFIAILSMYVINYVSRYLSMGKSSELKTLAIKIYESLFSDKGLPANWEETDRFIKIGLATDLYRIPIVVQEVGGISRNVTINVTINFDQDCRKKAWQSTVRVYENEVEVPVQLYNQTFCSENFLKSADVVFKFSITSNSQKIFFIYFSPEKNILPSDYSIEFPSTIENLSITILPEEQLKMISVSKLQKLRNISYDEIIQSLGSEFNIEISDR